MVACSREPKVSVVLPFHEDAELARAAAVSVLEQSVTDLEILIVNDGCRSDPEPVLSLGSQDPRITIIHHAQNRGASAARNSGADSAKGEYVAFLDYDDTWHPEKLERQLAWMNSATNARPASCTGFRIFTSFNPDGELRLLQAELQFNDLVWGCGASPGSTLMTKKECLRAVGPFDESLPRLEDWDWLLRCAQISPIAVVPEALAVIHTGSRDSYPLEKVYAAAKILESYAASGRYPMSKRQRRIFEAAIHTEVAAAAFLKRRYVAATGSLLKSVYYRPLKRFDFYRRIFWAAASDLKRACSSR